MKTSVNDERVIVTTREPLSMFRLSSSEFLRAVLIDRFLMARIVRDASKLLLIMA